MINRRLDKWILATSLAVLTAGARPAPAHESDQFTLPIGREFADLGGFFSDDYRQLLSRAVDSVNDRISRSLRDGRPTDATARLQSPEVIADAVLLQFPAAFYYVENLEVRLNALANSGRYPGLLVSYRPVFWIYHNPLLLLDVTKPVRLARSSTVMIDGVYLGTDKIVHFAHMGYLYFNEYRRGRSRGLSIPEAERASLTVGTNLNPFLSEDTLLGMLSTGVWSNADLAADYCGMKFYRNLTEEVLVRGQTLPPMLVKDGPYWRLADHVRRTEFFRPFVSDHWNEALVPNLYGPGIGAIVEAELRNRCDDVIQWYTGPGGRPMSGPQFAALTRSLTTYFGEDYGFRGDPAELVTIASTCFDSETSATTTSSRTPPFRDARLAVDIQRPPLRKEEGGRSGLTEAIRNGEISEVLTLLGRTSSATETDADGETPLHAAVRRGDEAILAKLLELSPDINAPSKIGLTPLHLAVRKHWPIGIHRLLDHGADPGPADPFGCTPLHDAAARQDELTTIALLDAGADVNATDHFGATPLHFAARSGAERVITALLERHASLTAQDQSGHTPSKTARLAGYRELAARLQSNPPAKVARP